MKIDATIDKLEGCNNYFLMNIKFTDGTEVHYSKHIPKNLELEKWFMSQFLFEISRQIEKMTLARYPEATAE